MGKDKVGPFSGTQCMLNSATFTCNEGLSANKFE